jgi:integrase
MPKPLTSLAVNSAKPGVCRREIPDAGCAGLYLVVQSSGAKSWAFRYRFAGRPKKLTLGPLFQGLKGDEPEQAVLDQPNTLAGARELATTAARQVAKGADPARAKQRVRQASRQRAELSELKDRDTVEAVAKAFIDKYARARNRGWRDTARILGVKPDPANDTQLVRSENGGHVLKAWGSRTIHEITRPDVHDLLDRVGSSAGPIAANRVLAVIRKMFAWAVSRDILVSSPCAGISPPSAEVSRDRILSDYELQLVWLASERLDYPFGHFVKMLILTLQRRDEVAGMRRSELDCEKNAWVLPAGRVKNKQEHEVPITDEISHLLADLPVIGKVGLVFTVTGETPVSGFSKAKKRLDDEIKKLGGANLPRWTFHDIRRTGASGMARLGIQLPVIEKVLNHTSGSFKGIVGVYQRHSFAEEKRNALEVWASFVQSVVSGKPPANVVALRGRDAS